MATRHVIIGAGPAGINAIETLRAIDSDSEIALVCDEPAYSRMVLPYYLEGKIDERAVMTGSEEWFSEHRVTTHLGVRVTAVDPGANQLSLDDGAQLGYDRLLIATGSRAACPPIDGLDGSGIVNLWTLADANDFLSEPRPHTVIVGAGFIAFTVLDAIATRSDRVTILEIEDRVLLNMLDAESSALMTDHLKQLGIEVCTGVRLGPWKAYLDENPIDLRRVYVASGAAEKLLESNLLTGRVSMGGGYRFPSLPAIRKRSSHHGTLLAGRAP